jgi:hypothetical protein
VRKRTITFNTDDVGRLTVDASRIAAFHTAKHPEQQPPFPLPLMQSAGMQWQPRPEHWCVSVIVAGVGEIDLASFPTQAGATGYHDQLERELAEYLEAQVPRHDQQDRDEQQDHDDGPGRHGVAVPAGEGT